MFYVWVSHGAIQLPNNYKPARIKCCWFDTPRYFTSLRVTHSINCSIDIIDWFAKSLSQDDLPIEQREYIQSIGSKMIIFVDKVSVTWLYPLNILRNWVFGTACSCLRYTYIFVLCLWAWVQFKGWFTREGVPFWNSVSSCGSASWNSAFSIKRATIARLALHVLTVL